MGRGFGVVLTLDVWVRSAFEYLARAAEGIGNGAGVGDVVKTQSYLPRRVRRRVKPRV